MENKKIVFEAEVDGSSYGKTLCLKKLPDLSQGFIKRLFSSDQLARITLEKNITHEEIFIGDHVKVTIEWGASEDEEDADDEDAEEKTGKNV